MSVSTRRWRRGVLAVCLIACAGLIAPAADAEDKGHKAVKQDEEAAGRNLAKEDPALQKEIEAAIDKGATWLLSLQKKDGTFGNPKGQKPAMFEKTPMRVGFNALVLYTLAHCGYDAKHKVMRKALAWLRKKYDSLYKGDHLRQASSYSLSLFVLGLHQLFAVPPDKSTDAKASRYGKSKAQKKNPCSYPKWVRRAIWRTLDWMQENRSEKGLFRYPGGLPGAPAPAGPAMGPNSVKRGPNYSGPEDLSCTQYVLLAFWVGTRCGYKVPEETLEAVANRILEIQEEEGPEVVRVVDPAPAPAKAEKDGERYAPPATPESDEKKDEMKDRARGFGYTPGDGATGAMTTAGLSSLMIVKAILDENYQLETKLRSRVDQGIWDGIAWLQQNYSIEGNHPLGAEWHYYYLYGLERALVIANKHMLGAHDWYVEGAKLLIKAQKKDGFWNPSHSAGGGGPVARIPICDTCFALLFLKRAAFTPKRPVLKGPEVTGGDEK